jgi:integrase
VSEACGLKLSQVDVDNRVVHVLRLKKGFREQWNVKPG